MKSWIIKSIFKWFYPFLAFHFLLVLDLISWHIINTLLMLKKMLDYNFSLLILKMLEYNTSNGPWILKRVEVPTDFLGPLIYM